MCVWLVVDTAIGFNPPSPCGEGPGKAGKLTIISEFQSTLPVWGGTVCVWLVVDTAIGFNPPSPCGEGPGKAGKLTIISEFQSTLPVWGGTCPSCRRWPRAAFQSTLPVWGGTAKVHKNSL